MPEKSRGLKLTRQVQIRQDDTSQKSVHVKLDAAVLHILRYDGLDRAQSQHARFVNLPASVVTNMHIRDIYQILL